MTVADGPLAELWAVFRDLTAEVEAETIDLDDVLRELQRHEVVDPFGRTWRIDPMTQAFIRRGTEAGAPWQPADPAEFTEAPVLDVAGQGLRDSGAGNVRRQPHKTAKRPRFALYPMVGGAALLILLLIVATTQLSGHRTEPQSQDEPIPTLQPSHAPAAPQPSTSPSEHRPAKPNSVPPPERCVAVLTEVSSGDMSRINRVSERSQYTYGNQRLHAAIYSGWADAGLTVDPKTPVGDPSGTSATQRWELHDGTTVIAVATVTWHRLGSAAPWLLAEWPEFQPTG
ncbi:hypothetical protein E1293_20725 [Actinomadura darangshiensis]|uniref:Uncharacterized protein n=1 Tax=Actinomadura darangshiensis TaxID=705336 RepID=A0A4V2YV69_9ACTN|nr:hypothetical protein [Actinomadura darangshiensis]TDD80437.1 hypothetical protein E1293_20725 [Actinomadura darangshiensis]